MTTELMLELAAHVHERCKDVPHDIGITLGEIVKRHEKELLEDNARLERQLDWMTDND